ncbi:hypothetical protein PG997_004924 [Apiospora hydei]|uniref:Uncharacterized protein n=1 Tax=Apiospora hydei TaxID=1337664 RepID=A0ABR1X3H3_9PEZI
MDDIWYSRFGTILVHVLAHKSLWFPWPEQSAYLLKTTTVGHPNDLAAKRKPTSIKELEMAEWVLLGRNAGKSVDTVNPAPGAHDPDLLRSQADDTEYLRARSLAYRIYVPRPFSFGPPLNSGAVIP